jgi:predicted O-methyltransferase YrrM
MNFTCDWVTCRCGEWRKHLAHLVGKEAHGLEIGSHEGRSAIWFCQNILTHSDSRLTCMDPWKMAPFTTFLGNVREARINKKLRIYSKPSQSLDFGHGKFDFIYVDGEHSAYAVLSDMVKGWEALKPGGVMIIDDYLWPPVKDSALPLVRPVDTFCAAVVPRLGNLLHKGYQVILRKL